MKRKAATKDQLSVERKAVASAYLMADKTAERLVQLMDIHLVEK